MTATTFAEHLTTAQVDEALEQSHDIWSGGLSLSERTDRTHRRMREAGPGRVHMSGLLDENGRLVASLKRYYFEIQLGGEILSAVGLGAIYTPTQHRKQGLASKLIHAVLGSSRTQKHCKAAVLYSDIGTSYYERLGFQALQASTWSLPATLAVGSSSFQLRAATASDLAELVRLYELRTGSFAARTVRSPTSWQFFHDLNGITRSYFVDRDGEALGLVSVTAVPSRDYLWVDECCVPSNHAADVLESVAALADGLSELRGWGSPLLSALRAVKGFDEQPRPRAIPMIADLRAITSVITIGESESYFASPDHF